MKARILVRKLKLARDIYVLSFDEAWLEIKYEIETKAIIVIQS